MRSAIAVLLVLTSCSTAFAASLVDPISGIATSPRLVKSYGQLPLQFEKNAGQTDRRVKFLAHGRGETLFLTGAEAVLCLTRSTGKRQRFDPKDPMSFKRPDHDKRITSVLRALASSRLSPCSAS